MKIYGKIVIATLPLAVCLVFATVGTTYYFSRTALTDLARTWLETRLSEAMRIAAEQEDILHKYGLENISASIAKSQQDAGTLMSGIVIGNEGYVLAVDRQGIVAVHPDAAMVGVDVSDEDWFRKISPGKGQLAYPAREGRTLALYDYFEPWQWYILAADPERDLYRAINRMKPYVLSLGIIGSIAMAAALMSLTRKLTEPLEALTASAERIGGGDLKTRIALRSQDEFGRLADMFNQMAAKLQETLTTVQFKEEYFRSLIENASDIIVILDADGIVLFASPSVERILGRFAKEMIGRNAFDFIHPDQRPRIMKKFHERVRSTLPLDPVEFDFQHKDGSWRTLESTARNLLNHPAVKGYVVNCRDITARKQAEKALQESHQKLEQRVRERTGELIRMNRELRKEISERKQAVEALQTAKKMEAIGTLAGGVAHDLNNILSGIVSYPELLLMDLPEDSPLRNPIKTIQKSGERAATIVQDLLTMARRGVAVREVVNIGAIVGELLKSPECVYLKKRHPNVRISVDIASDLMNIKGSAVHLSKSIMNLVMNAAEAMPGGGEMRISSQNAYIDKPGEGCENVGEGDYVILAISDTGTGIPKADKERIFEPFYTKKKMGRSGSGLGMAVVWGTVKDHDGHIFVRSEEGKGTTFTLYFPATREEMPDSIHQSLEQFKGRGERVLIVDDSEVQRNVARSILEKLGYQAATVPSGEDAVDFIRKTPVDLLVLDMIMPDGMDGLDTYRQIVQVSPGQKAVIASGFSETDRVAEVQRIGAGRYIRKPYSIETIARAVREALG